jgi:TetR/AcrR family transcriptional repressor of nem operon
MSASIVLALDFALGTLAREAKCGFRLILKCEYIMRKSKADTAETRKHILLTASDMLLREGISATAISDVMVAAGLTQGGFYRHFQSKEHMVAEASATAFDGIFARFDTATAGKSPRESIDIIVHGYLNQLSLGEAGQLCPLGNLSSELRLADDQVKSVVVEGYARMVKLLASYLMRLDYTDYVGLAEGIVSVLVGAFSISRVAVDPDMTASILKNAEVTVNLLLKSAPTSAGLVKAA